MFNPDMAPISLLPLFETAGRLLEVVPIIAPVHDDVEIETATIALGREPRGGLVVMSDAFTVAHRAPTGAVPKTAVTKIFGGAYSGLMITLPYFQLATLMQQAQPLLRFEF
jgi:hypothetical protein